ncbi:MAG: hypothetical protein CL424_07750 [Acidimicrobiaceae bacterium]|nr:hypothetical protein [Acidimicrobiaceae bacterium]
MTHSFSQARIRASRFQAHKEIAGHDAPHLAEQRVRDGEGRRPTLGEVAIGSNDFRAALIRWRDGDTSASASLIVPFRNLVTSPRIGPPTIGLTRPELAATPLLDAITVVPDVESGTIVPVTFDFESAADEVAEGAAAGEADITYDVGELVNLPTITHGTPVTTQALKHNEQLRADIDTLLTGGLLVNLEDAVGEALVASSGVVAHDFDTDVATTIRTGIAAAQSAFRELGPGMVTVALSPTDHATLDLADFDLGQWPARIISTPSISSGTAFIGRLGLAVRAYVNEVLLTLGYIDDQFIKNQRMILGSMEGYVHITAPAAIIAADLTGDDLS